MCPSRNMFRSTAVLLSTFAVSVLVIPAADNKSQPAPLTAAQKERLRERDRYGAEARKLRQAGKLPEAIATAEKMLAVEREVFGNFHEDVAGSLEQIAGMHERREDLTA